jgi:hypothetical protein
MTPRVMAGDFGRGDTAGIGKTRSAAERGMAYRSS